MTPAPHVDGCPHHLAFEARIERTEEDVQRLYTKQDRILWATISAAGASILTLVGMLASFVIG
jgi:hypothetical protein